MLRIAFAALSLVASLASTSGQQAEPVRPRSVTQAAASDGCSFPKASVDAVVLMLSTYGTGAISTSTIGSQDLVVQAGKIIVEPGQTPLYVVIVTHRAVIWQFSGDVARIERVLLSGTQNVPNGTDPKSPPATGVTGLPEDRVSYLPSAGCLNYFTEVPSIAAAKAAGPVRKGSGKDPAMFGSEHAVLGFTVPSGKMQMARGDNPTRLIIQKDAGTLRIVGDTSNIVVQSGPRSLLDQFVSFSPGGLVKIDPANVVSSQPAERYLVLPQEAGLLQLVNSGALSVNRGGEYLIHKKMRFPPGLDGAHAVKFLLLRDVPEPDGRPGHSEVVSEATGQSLRGR